MSLVFFFLFKTGSHQSSRQWFAFDEKKVLLQHFNIIKMTHIYTLWIIAHLFFFGGGNLSCAMKMNLFVNRILKVIMTKYTNQLLYTTMTMDLQPFVNVVGGLYRSLRPEFQSPNWWTLCKCFQCFPCNDRPASSWRPPGKDCEFSI